MKKFFLIIVAAIFLLPFGKLEAGHLEEAAGGIQGLEAAEIFARDLRRARRKII